MATQYARTESADTFAADWFATHPDCAIDKRTPAQKLEEIRSSLQQVLTDQERFRLLAQQKTLAVLERGQKSSEAFRALVALAEFYNEQSRPESALRHLMIAKEVREEVKTPRADDFRFYLEYAEAALASNLASKRLLQSAEKGLRYFISEHPDDRRRCFRRDLCLARFDQRNERFDDAVRQYERARQNVDEGSPDHAKLEDELGDLLRRKGDRERSQDAYRRAHEMFVAREMFDCARPIDQKIDRVVGTERRRSFVGEEREPESVEGEVALEV